MENLKLLTEKVFANAKTKKVHGCLYAAVLMFAFCINAQAQNNDFYPGKVWVIVHDSTIIPEEGRESKNAAFAQVLASYSVTEITQPMYFAKTPELRRVFELNTTLNEDSLFSALNAINTDNGLFLSVEKCPVPQILYNPDDYMWELTLQDTNNWLWNLKRMQADLAWDITKGCPSVKVAVTDNGIDPNHPDLIGKIYPPYPFSAQPGTPFSVGNGHGTAVAGLIAAETVDAGQTENGQLASVGYNTRIMFDYMGLSNCVYASTVKHAQILSLSWHYTSCSPSTTDLLAEQEILGNGTTIIRAAGNGNGSCNGGRLYPFSGKEDPRTIVVSSTNKYNKHYMVTNGHSTHSHYAEVDLCAPGYEVFVATPTSNSWPYYGNGGGTSLAAPQVAGVAALMHCVNPCLAPDVCQDILKNTTDPIADAANYPGKVGTGRVNAFKAVKAAQGMYKSNALDLYIKDRPNDFGYETAPFSWYPAVIDKSPDIWVRRQPDGLTNQVNQNPLYNGGQPNYVYVRVWNKSCDESFGQGNLKLYWTKFSTSSSWTQGYWNGSYGTNVGNIIGTKAIPNIKPGESTILEFQWYLPNPDDDDDDIWSRCLLARIDNISADQITPYNNQLELEVYKNNNVALRNVTLVKKKIFAASNDPMFSQIGRAGLGTFMYIGNVQEHPESYDIRFGLPWDEESPSIIAHGEAHIITDSIGWNILYPALAENAQVRIVGERHFRLLSDTVVLRNLEFPANTRAQIYVGFNFLTEQANDDSLYLYSVSQWYSDSVNHTTGAGHFEIYKEQRTPFYANAGDDQTIRKNTSTSMNAVEIEETVIYNWIAPNGNVISSERNVTVSPNVTATYTLEVISTEDGYKDYDEVTVNVQQFWIEQIAPNPTEASTTVSYNIEGANSAKIKIYNQSGILQNSHTLQTNSTSLEINVSSYAPGTYTIVLEADGSNVDAKTLIVQ